MTNKLSIAVFVGTLFNLSNATDATSINHMQVLTSLVEACKTEAAQKCPVMIQSCPSLKNILEDVQKRNTETGIFNLTEEEKSLIEKCHNGHALAEEVQKEISTAETSVVADAKEEEKKLLPELPATPEVASPSSNQA
jgi:hypothetical protein